MNMNTTRMPLRSAFIAFLALAWTGAADQSNAHEHHAQLAIAWNERVNEISYAEDQWFTLKGVRAHAMMHVAMHDALNAISPRYQPYVYSVFRHNQRNIDP